MCAETKPKNELDQWPKKYFVLVGFVLIFFSVLVVFRGWLKTVFIFLWSRFLRPKISQKLFFFLKKDDARRRRKMELSTVF